MLWSLTTQSSLVAIIVAIATTLALLLRSRRALYVRFALFAGSVAVYYATNLLTAIFGEQPILASSRIIAGGLVVVTATAFFDAILGITGGAARRRRGQALAVGVVLIIVGVSPFAQSFAVASVSAALALFVLATRVWSVLARASLVASAAERTRLRYLGYGGVFALLGHLCDAATLLGFVAPPVGGLLVAIYLYFISQALLMSRLLDLHELLGRALVFGTLALILAVVYGLLYVWVGERRGLFLSNTLVASSLILILFEPLKTYLEEAATRVFFREHYTFARELRKLVRHLATIIELPAAFDAVLSAIYDSKRATHTSLYLKDRDGLRFGLEGYRGAPPAPIVDGTGHPQLIAHLLRAQTPLLREAVTRRLEEARGRASLASGTPITAAQDEALLLGLDALHADLVVPLRFANHVVGIVCLKDERLSEAYASDEIAAVLEVADQLSITIENSRVFGLLRERDRLATLGEMSAGLAHEIRNPLAAIKGAAQELDPKRRGGDDAELMQVIIDEVNRLNTVVSEFLDYARPFRGTFTALSVNDAVRKTSQLMAHDLGKSVVVDLQLAHDLPDVNGDPERLQQVLINLILNAAQAMDRRGRITISTSHVDAHDPSPTRAGFVEVRVRDEGPGLPPNVRQQIFIPFFTTKAHGTGLGLALCQRIVEHHGGVIEARGREGEGAVFVVRLPALPTRIRSAAVDAAAPAG